MPRPDRQWVRFHGTISTAVKNYIKKQARDWEVELGTALDVLVWRNCLQPSDQEWQCPAKLSQETLERSFGEDALDALLDPRAIRLLEEKLFEEDEPPGGRTRKTQVLLKRWRRFRQIDPGYKSDVLEVMHALGKKPTIETASTIDIEEWCLYPMVLGRDRWPIRGRRQLHSPKKPQ